MLNQGFNGEPVASLPLGERAFVLRVNVRERKTGGYMVPASTLMYAFEGGDLCAVTRVSENLLQVELNLFSVPCAVIER